MRSGISLALSPSARGGQTPGQARPVKAVSRRSRARTARALTGVGWSGNALAKRDADRSDQIATTLVGIGAGDTLR